MWLVTAAECAKLVAVLVATYPNARVNALTSEAYERMLADLDYPSANAAVEKLLATSRFMPTIAEIREGVLALANGERRPGGEAWGEVHRLISRFGARRYDEGIPPPMADEVSRQVVDALGWSNLCDSENQVADRARFIELYDRLALTHRNRQLSESLPAMQRYKALRSSQLTRERSCELSAARVQPEARIAHKRFCELPPKDGTKR